VSFPELNFPPYPFRLRLQDGKHEIFDEIRKKWLLITPEEWVRQHAAKWLSSDKSYPASLLAIEKTIRVNGLSKRCDIVAYGKDAKPLLVVECKAPGVQITQQVFDQAARYNMTLQVPLFLLTNGRTHFCCQVNHVKQEYVFLKELPVFET
jgi:type I site-specific restriction endonuclease